MKHIIISLFILFLSACLYGESHITRVQVRVLDGNFEVIKDFKQKIELRKIEQIWGSREKIKINFKPTFKYKLDIVTENNARLWLYDPNGYCMILSKAKVPIFYIKEYKELNQMIN